MKQTRWAEGRHLHYGYTTGTCAAGAAKAAAEALLTGIAPKQISLLTPKGWELLLAVEDYTCTPDRVSCGVRKNAGDDPDATDGMLIYATVRKDEHLQPGEVSVDGGRGIGRVTRAGLDQPVGAAAINSTPRRMIREAVLEVCQNRGYAGGMAVEIWAPEGEQIAKETYNGKLGILGGISILGTSGIVEPMSNQAMIDTMDTEMAVMAAEGTDCLLLVLGNYGERFAGETLGLSLEHAVKCSNYVGEALHLAVKHHFRQLLLVGHIGKLAKLGLGIMNTHSGEGDGRMEALLACGLTAGVPVDTLRALQQCITTDGALEILRQQNMLEPVMTCLRDKTMGYLHKKTAGQLQVEVICFTNRETLPPVLYQTAGADEAAACHRENAQREANRKTTTESEQTVPVVVDKAADRTSGEIFLFGGTTEGRELAEQLAAMEQDTHVFVATEYGSDLLDTANPRLRVHRGRMDRPAMEQAMQETAPMLVVDATHPYAEQVSQNIRRACENTGIPYLRVLRKDADATQPTEGTATEQDANCQNSHLHYFDSLADMIAWVNGEEGTVFSSLGTKELPALQQIQHYRERLIARVLPTVEAMEVCRDMGLKGNRIIAMQGPFSKAMNTLQFRECGARILLTKESGANGGYGEKIAAAMECGMEAGILRRPPQDAEGKTMEEILYYIRNYREDKGRLL